MASFHQHGRRFASNTATATNAGRIYDYQTGRKADMIAISL